MTESNFQDLYDDFREAYIARYGEKSYEENKQIATDNIEQLLKHGVRRHYQESNRKAAQTKLSKDPDYFKKIGSQGGKRGKQAK